MLLQRSSRQGGLLVVTFVVVATFWLYYRYPASKGSTHYSESEDTSAPEKLIASGFTSLPVPTNIADTNPFTPPASPLPISPPAVKETKSQPKPPAAAGTSHPTITQENQTEAQHGIGNITKTFVVPSLKKDDTKWIEKYLPDWEYVRYVTDEPVGELKVPKNKGNEAMVYLTYIIDHYDNLPDLVVFIHSQRFQWHNDDPLWDNAYLLANLQIPYLLSQPYTNLRCVWTLGCPSDIKGINQPVPTYLDANDKNLRKHLSFQYAIAFPILFPHDPVPTHVSVPCCAQFATTRSSILRRPKSQYVKIRQWLLDTELENDISGRIMEFSWHVMFGAPAFSCPHAGECYCKLYGECGEKGDEEVVVELLGFGNSAGKGEMVRETRDGGRKGNGIMKGCGKEKCGKRWDWPPGRAWPKNWPEEGWNGEIRSAEEVTRLRNLGVADKPKEEKKKDS